jgi:quinol monooxygenase YgiN
MILIMRERVRDYDAWKSVFDGGEPLRAKHGCTGHEIFRSDDDGNDLTVHLHFPSREAGDALRADPELAATMKRAGVETPPTVTWVCEAESLKYTGRRAA